MEKINWEAEHGAGKKYTPMPEELIDRLIKKANGAKTALDIGCGTGDVLMKLAKRGLSVTGIDISSTALSKARELFEGSGFEVTLINSDFNKPNFTAQISEKIFDIIIIRASFASVDDKDAFCKEIKKVMDADSIFVCSTGILLDRIEYTPKQNRASVPKKEVEDVLATNFSNVSVINKTELNRKKWPLRTYLCRNN